MYCKNCGTEMDEGASYCPKCGSAQTYNTKEPYSYQQQPMVYDSGSFGWAVLGFLIPLIGLILWIVWLKEKPKSAKMAGLGALVSFVLSIIFYTMLLSSTGS